MIITLFAKFQILIVMDENIQIMYCYAMNGRCSSPGHLWLTGCHGEMEIQLQRLPGFDKWIIEKENRPYVEAFQDRKEHLVYLTADSENILEEMDPTKIYIVGGLVDRNRWKGITMKKAEEQGIQTAKLPIGNYLKMSGSKVWLVFGTCFVTFVFCSLKIFAIDSRHLCPHCFLPILLLFRVESFCKSMNFKFQAAKWKYDFFLFQLITKT